jgi:hypothetical protein
MVMMTTLFFLLLALHSASSTDAGNGACTAADRRIWLEHGAQWPHQFRDLGGLFVSTASYEERVRHLTGMTEACSQCYGQAYNCGYDNCKWSCATEGPSCVECLTTAGCISRCDVCTGFGKKSKKKT